MSLVALNRTTVVSDAQQYRLLCLVILPFFLTAVVAGRILRVAQGHARRPVRSILAEARAASANAILFAFQG